MHLDVRHLGPVLIEEHVDGDQLRLLGLEVFQLLLDEPFVVLELGECCGCHGMSRSAETL